MMAFRIAQLNAILRAQEERFTDEPISSPSQWSPEVTRQFNRGKSSGPQSRGNTPLGHALPAGTTRFRGDAQRTPPDFDLEKALFPTVPEIVISKGSLGANRDEMRVTRQRWSLNMLLEAPR